VIEIQAPFMIGTKNWLDGISETLLSASTKDLWALGIGFSLFFVVIAEGMNSFTVFNGMMRGLVVILVRF